MLEALCGGSLEAGAFYFGRKFWAQFFEFEIKDLRIYPEIVCNYVQLCS
jgi:hypothetical protein